MVAGASSRHRLQQFQTLYQVGCWHKYHAILNLLRSHAELPLFVFATTGLAGLGGTVHLPTVETTV